ncbi:MAG: nuclear transport factor 2 family protein [Pseudomonadales bacterium]|jgi:ketosteroid isomerase-like protein|nr:nuclear transport factor 2 family protein [Pseudomonadales bacterium]
MSELNQETLRKVSDLEEIRALKNRYAYGANIVDGEPGDLTAFAALFTDDAVFDVGMGVATGPAEIEAQMKELTVQWQSAMHYMLNPLIEITGDNANATFTGLFAFTTRENPAPIWLCNLYTDTFRRTAAGWRFTSVSVQTVFADPAFLVGYEDQLAE